MKRSGRNLVLVLATALAASISPLASAGVITSSAMVYVEARAIPPQNNPVAITVGIRPGELIKTDASQGGPISFANAHAEGFLYDTTHGVFRYGDGTFNFGLGGLGWSILTQRFEGDPGDASVIVRLTYTVTLDTPAHLLGIYDKDDTFGIGNGYININSPSYSGEFGLFFHHGSFDVPLDAGVEYSLTFANGFSGLGGPQSASAWGELVFGVDSLPEVGTDSPPETSTPTPEPASLAIWGVGAVGAAIVTTSRKRRAQALNAH
jgi:hypothetical protein